jgi:predicted CxxxxCH...CXXCH cytochrome family protein
VHPEGWAFPDVHGLAVKLQTDVDCRTCHGDRLQGGDLGAGIACDDCHYDDDWEGNCTFCHGGVEDNTGAPPEDIDDRSDELAFPPHTVHVTRTIHAPFDCEQCHRKPQDALTPGHLFDDDTPARAEVAFADGLSPQGAWDGNGTCTNVYCHGDGRVNGDATVGEQRTCEMCHQDAALSGEHDLHLGDADAVCGECHADVVEGTETILAPGLHVDGAVSVTLPAGMTRTGNRCTGSCHDEDHDDAEYTWD